MISDLSWKAADLWGLIFQTAWGFPLKWLPRERKLLQTTGFRKLKVFYCVYVWILFLAVVPGISGLVKVAFHRPKGWVLQLVLASIQLLASSFAFLASTVVIMMGKEIVTLVNEIMDYYQGQIQRENIHFSSPIYIYWSVILFQT